MKIDHPITRPKFFADSRSLSGAGLMMDVSV